MSDICLFFEFSHKFLLGNGLVFFVFGPYGLIFLIVHVTDGRRNFSVFGMTVDFSGFGMMVDGRNNMNLVVVDQWLRSDHSQNGKENAQLESHDFAENESTRSKSKKRHV
eukprot:scpid105360/ scgid29761/ 